jgi:hypothetical protein
LDTKGFHLTSQTQIREKKHKLRRNADDASPMTTGPYLKLSMDDRDTYTSFEDQLIPSASSSSTSFVGSISGGKLAIVLLRVEATCAAAFVGSV